MAIFSEIKGKYCPYCYEKLPEPREYYCVKCNEEIVSQKDISRYNTNYAGIPMCVCGGGPMMIRCKNDKCRQIRNIIPVTDTCIVVIAGMRSSGKSTYLLDLVNSQSNETGIIISPKSHYLIEWKTNGIQGMKNNTGLDSTVMGDDNFSSVFGMSVMGKSNELCVSLTDRPGEETQNLNHMLSLNYLYCADYIILFIDSLNIPGIAEQLTAKGIQFPDEAEKTPNISAVENLIAATDAQRGKYGKKIPFFLGISKWDYIEKADMCPPGFSIGCNGADLSSVLGANRKFDKKKWKANCLSLRNFLISHNEGNLVLRLEQYFKDVNFFAFSNFGTPPKIENQVIKLPIHKPRHIMDPFYRILNDKRMI